MKKNITARLVAVRTVRNATDLGPNNCCDGYQRVVVVALDTAPSGVISMVQLVDD